MLPPAPRAGAAALSDRLQAQTALSQASLAQVRDEGALSNALGVIALVTSGYNMSLLPFVMESGEMLLKININMTSRPTFEMQTSGPCPWPGARPR